MRRFPIVFAAVFAGIVSFPLGARAQNPVVLDTWCAANGYTLHRDGTHDDSQCVSQAAAYASSNNYPLYVPSGGPILMGGGY